MPFQPLKNVVPKSNSRDKSATIRQLVADLSRLVGRANMRDDMQNAFTFSKINILHPHKAGAADMQGAGTQRGPKQKSVLESDEEQNKKRVTPKEIVGNWRSYASTFPVEKTKLFAPFPQLFCLHAVQDPAMPREWRPLPFCNAPLPTYAISVFGHFFAHNSFKYCCPLASKAQNMSPIADMDIIELLKGVSEMVRGRGEGERGRIWGANVACKYGIVLLLVEQLWSHPEGGNLPHLVANDGGDFLDHLVHL